MLPLQALTPRELAFALPLLTPEEARKIVSAVHRWREPVGLRRASLAAILAATHVPTVKTVREERSAVDPFVKLVLELADGKVVETVRIPLERAGRFSACVSSQVGCALACAFCATGRMGLLRNLETWEIVEQVRVIRQGLDPSRRERVHGVVFQGMGEPLANLDRVLAAIRVMCDPCALAIDARNITVCTSGIPSGIRRLALEAPKVRLGLSIAGARAGVRRSLMPIDESHPLEAVLDAAAFHAETTGLAPMWAVTLLAGKNDGEEDGRALGALAGRFVERCGVRPRISIIPYNPIAEEGDPFLRSSAEAEARFREGLGQAGFAAHKRYSGGGDVGAACGQLASRV